MVSKSSIHTLVALGYHFQVATKMDLTQCDFRNTKWPGAAFLESNSESSPVYLTKEDELPFKPFTKCKGSLKCSIDKS